MGMILIGTTVRWPLTWGNSEPSGTRTPNPLITGPRVLRLLKSAHASVVVTDGWPKGDARSSIAFGVLARCWCGGHGGAPARGKPGGHGSSPRADGSRAPVRCTADAAGVCRTGLRPCSSRALANSKERRVAGTQGQTRTGDLELFVQVEAVVATRGECPQQDSNLRHTV